MFRSAPQAMVLGLLVSQTLDCWLTVSWKPLFNKNKEPKRLLMEWVFILGVCNKIDSRTNRDSISTDLESIHISHFETGQLSCFPDRQSYRWRNDGFCLDSRCEQEARVSVCTVHARKCNNIQPGPSSSKVDVGAKFGFYNNDGKKELDKTLATVSILVMWLF